MTADLLALPPGDGWRPEPLDDGAVLCDALYVGGAAIAFVVAYDDDGPWYASATTPEGEERRLGAGESAAAAVLWAERTAGYRAARPARNGGDNAQA